MGTRADRGQMTGWLAMSVALVVLTIAVYSIASDHPEAMSEAPAAEPTVEYVPDEVRTLLSFADSMTVGGTVAGGHEFTAAGVRYVAAALGVVASSAGLDIDPALEAIREGATRIERDPRPRERAEQARVAFRALAMLFDAVQRARFRGLEPDVANVSRAASRLRADFRLIDQRDAVQEFLSGAASAVRAMNRELSSSRSRISRSA